MFLLLFLAQPHSVSPGYTLLGTLVHWSVLQEHLELSYPASDCSLRRNLGVRERQLATVELNSLCGFSEKTFLVVNKTMTIMLCWSLLISVVCLQETRK